MNSLWTHNVQKAFLAIAPLRTVSKGHRLKESFPTRCVPSRAVIWQTHEKHPVTTEENSLRDKGDSCTNIFSMPGLCRAAKCLVLNLLKPSYIKSPQLFPRKIKGIELQNETSQKSQTSWKMNKPDFACGKFYRNLLTLPERLVWFCFEFLPLGSCLRTLGQISVLAFKLQSVRGVFDTAPGQRCHTGCPELHNVLAPSSARTQPATPLLQGFRAERKEERCNLEGWSFAWCTRENKFITKARRN